MVENNCCYAEGELAKSCRVALEKSYGMAIPVPKFSYKKNHTSVHCRNLLVKMEEHWSSVV